MKILITGCAGFIGSNLSEHLLEKGHQVVGIDNFNNYYDPKVKHYNIKDIKGRQDSKLFPIDILDREAVGRVFADEHFDAVIHLAAYAGVTYSVEYPVENVRNNVEATVILLEACKKHKVNNFLFASTSSVYGDNPTPFKEDMNTDLVLAPYPATKKACEVLLYTYAQNFGINTSIFRIFNPLGLRMRPDLALPMVIRSCEFGTEFPMYWTWEQAEKTGRDYCYVGHIFEAFESVLAKPHRYEIFNLGNSSPETLKSFISTIEKVCGKKANIKVMPNRKGEMFLTYANVDKARTMLGYNPSTTMEQMIKKYHDWFMHQEDWYKLYGTK